MSKKLVALIAAVGLAAAAPAVAPAAQSTHTPTARAAKTCSSGFKHAVIGGQQKCLRRGEFCARRHASQYRRNGYRCVKRDARGNYHLT